MKQVQIDGFMVLKINKHYQEGQGTERVQGVLWGLAVEDQLEITNCFPFPQHTEDDADFDEGKGTRLTVSLQCTQMVINPMFTITFDVLLLGVYQGSLVLSFLKKKLYKFSEMKIYYKTLH